MTLIVNDMTASDVPAIAQIERECFSRPWTEEGLSAELSNNTAHFLAARNDSDVVGYMGFHAILDEGYVANIAVLPQYRRMGVAAALLNEAIKRSGELGLSFLSLEVRCSNEAAIALYEKFGFAAVGRRRRFYSAPTEDALIMTRRF